MIGSIERADTLTLHLLFIEFFDLEEKHGLLHPSTRFHSLSAPYSDDI